MVMVQVQYCVMKDGFWIQRATPLYFLGFVGCRVQAFCSPPCRLVRWPAALPASQIAEWYVHKDLCNKTTRSLVHESTDWRLRAQTFSELWRAEVATAVDLPVDWRELKLQ